MSKVKKRMREQLSEKEHKRYMRSHGRKWYPSHQDVRFAQSFYSPKKWGDWEYVKRNFHSKEDKLKAELKLNMEPSDKLFCFHDNSGEKLRTIIVKAKNMTQAKAKLTSDKNLAKAWSNKHMGLDEMMWKDEDWKKYFDALKGSACSK